MAQKFQNQRVKTSKLFISVCVDFPIINESDEIVNFSLWVTNFDFFNIMKFIDTSSSKLKKFQLLSFFVKF